MAKPPFVLPTCSSLDRSNSTIHSPACGDNHTCGFVVFQLGQFRPFTAYHLTRPGDVLLAREGEERGQQYGLRQRIEKEEGGPMACRVLPWRNGDDVHSAFERELGLANPKPPAQEAVAEHLEAGDVVEG